MATLLADPPAGQASQPAAPPTVPDGAPSAQPPAAATRPCANCGAPLAPGQDWCLQCGQRAPGSLTGSRGGWRSGAAVLAAVAILAAGAAAAAYAAFTKSSTRPRTVRTLAQAPAATLPPASAGATPTTPGAATGATPNIGAPTTVKPVVPLPKAKAVLPGVAGSAGKVPAVKLPSAPAVTGGGPAAVPRATPTTPTAGSGAAAAESEAASSALTLDTNAAATYNPYGYPPSDFGDPSLAIDGEPSTAWTARVNPAVAPRMAEGLVIDLNSPQRIAAVALVSSTPGLSVQVYGANGSAAPTSITDTAWKRLSGLRVDRKHNLRIPLSNSKKAFRFVVLWISKAPASAVGTPQAPGHVSVNELELFPARK